MLQQFYNNQNVLDVHIATSTHCSIFKYGFLGSFVTDSQNKMVRLIGIVFFLTYGLAKHISHVLLT